MPHSLTWIVRSFIIIITVSVVALGSQGAHPTVKHLHYDNPKLNQDVDFPLVLGSTYAAKNINLHLQNRFLDDNGFFVDNSTIRPHEEVKLPNISYVLYPTSHALFSVRFSLTESGEEEYLESFLFDAHTGKLVPLKKLFSAKGFAHIKAKLTKLKQKRAQQSTTRYSANSLEGKTIQECANNGVKFVRFFVICDILVFEEESCSGNLHLEHDIAPYYLLSYREILSHLSGYGKKLLGAKGCNNLHSNEINTPEILHEITEWLIRRLKEIKNQTGTASLDAIIQHYNSS